MRAKIADVKDDLGAVREREGGRREELPCLSSCRVARATATRERSWKMAVLKARTHLQQT